MRTEDWCTYVLDWCAWCDAADWARISVRSCGIFAGRRLDQMKNSARRKRGKRQSCVVIRYVTLIFWSRNWIKLLWARTATERQAAAQSLSQIIYCYFRPADYDLPPIHLSLTAGHIDQWLRLNSPARRAQRTLWWVTSCKQLATLPNKRRAKRSPAVMDYCSPGETCCYYQPTMANRSFIKVIRRQQLAKHTVRDVNVTRSNRPVIPFDCEISQK